MSWQWLNLAAAEYATKTPPPDYCGIVYKGRRHVYSGPPESAKTLAAWIVGLHVVRSGHGVAIVDFEMGPNPTRELLDDLGFSPDEILNNVFYLEADGPPHDEDIAGIVDEGIAFVIIDSAAAAYDVSGLDDEKRKDVQRFARQWVDPLWRNGIATGLIDHVVKNTENRGKYAIGSERKIGTCDVHLGFEVVKPLTRGSDGLAKIRTHRDRPAWLNRPYVAELELRSDPQTHAITWRFREPATAAAADVDGWQPTVLMEKVSRWLESQAEPKSRNEVEGARLGKSRDYVRHAMDALLAGGYVLEQPGPKRARLLTSVQPFRTSPDFAPTSPGEDVATSPTSPSAYRRGEVTGEDEVGWLSGEDIPFPDHEPDYESQTA